MQVASNEAKQRVTVLEYGLRAVTMDDSTAPCAPVITVLKPEVNDEAHIPAQILADVSPAKAHLANIARSRTLIWLRRFSFGLASFRLERTRSWLRGGHLAISRPKPDRFRPTTAGLRRCHRSVTGRAPHAVRHIEGVGFEGTEVMLRADRLQS